MWRVLDKSYTNVNQIAYTLGIVSIFGLLLSFLRDRALAHQFGASELLDVYIASFRIPDILFITVTAFISVYALLPMLEEKKNKGAVEFTEFINTTFYTILAFLVFGSLVLFFVIPIIAENFFYTLSGDNLETFISLSRVFLIQAAMFSISSFFIAILQLKRKFLLYAILPIIYNLGIIFGVIFLFPKYGIFGSAIGLFIGLSINILLQILILKVNDVFPMIAPTKRMFSEVWRSIKLSVPRASALLSIGVANILIFSTIVSISEGALSIYYFADNLKSVPVIVVGVAFSIATFPILVEHFQRKEMDNFRGIIEKAFSQLIFLILPLIAYIFMLREPLVDLFFETGAFSTEAAFITSAIVGVFVFGALATSVLALSARALYACGKTLLPFLVFTSLAVAQIFFVKNVVNILETNRETLLGILEFTGITSGGFGILFATIATIVVLESIAAIVIFIILKYTIKQEMKMILKSLLENVVAVLFLVLSIKLTKDLIFDFQDYNLLENFFAISITTMIAAIVWYAALRFMRNKQIEVVKNKIERIIKRVWRI